MKCINIKKVIGLFLVLFLISGKALANSMSEIRLAVLDNFHFQKNITNQFDQYYKPGITLAQKKAEDLGYHVNIKYFGYDRTPLGVMRAIPKVKAWHPDIVIGPRNSNVFLLLENQFRDILVLSPFATANNVSTMPKNFYSLAFPDDVFARSVVDYVQVNYPNKKIFGLIESDCKNCVDMSDNFKHYYEKINPKSKIHYNYFFQLEKDNIDIKKLLQDYNNEPLIFLPDNSAISSILMPMIVNELKEPRVFIGGDDWGSWKNTQIGKIQADFPYEGLRFTPWSFENKTKKMEKFLREYHTYYNREPEDEASYMGYNAAMSFLLALKKYESSISGSMKEKILASYQLALLHDKNWFRQKSYAVYKVSPATGSHFSGTFPANIQ